MSISQDKKLTVNLRIEPGCLGPEGSQHIEAFCKYSSPEISKIYSNFLLWNVVPRYDKTLPETDYQIKEKQLTRDQATRYLALFEQNIDDLEMMVFDAIPGLIDDYLGR